MCCTCRRTRNDFPRIACDAFIPLIAGSAPDSLIACAASLVTGEYSGRVADNMRLTVALGGSNAHWSYWTPASMFGAPAGYDSKTRNFSAEARLASETAPEGGFDWMAGVYASSLKKTAPHLFETPGAFRSATHADVEGNTAAVFGELGSRFAPKWRVAGALRYEHDRRRLDWLSQQSGRFDSDDDNIPDTTYDTIDRVSGLKVRDNVLLPRLTFEFRPDAQQFVWASVARGYKASGFNLYATSPSSAESPFAPEYGTTAELGYRIKGNADAWLLSATVFHTRLRDQQVVVVGSAGQTLVANAGCSHSQGVDFNATVRPTRQLDINAYAGFVRTVYDDYVNGNVNYAGRQFPNALRQTFGVAVNWRPASGWEAGMAWRHVGDSNLYPASTVTNRAYDLLDAHVSYRIDRWTVGFYGKNLGDKRYFTRAMNANSLVAAAPRSLNVRVSLDFRAWRRCTLAPPPCRPSPRSTAMSTWHWP